MSDSSPSDPNWTEHTFELGLRRGLMTAIGLWQVLMIWSVLAAPLSPSMRTALLTAQGLIVVLAWLVVIERAPLALLLGALYATFLLNYSATELGSTLHLAAVWQGIILYSLPGALLPRKAAILVTLAAAIVLPTGVVIAHPEWSVSVPISMAALIIAMTTVFLAATHFLRSFARSADLATAQAEAEHRAVTVSRRASQQASEDGRVLHDSVINTLGAIANGGAGVADPGVVRARCAHDAKTVKALLEGREVDIDDLDEVLATLGIEIRRSGLTTEDWVNLDLLLTRDMAKALRGSVGEAVRNAAKHSGARHVDVATKITAEELVVTVADQGVGFDRTFSQGRGLAESLIGRAQAAGIRIELETAPGQGTTVHFSCPLAGDSATATASGDALDLVDGGAGAASVLRRACWFFAIGLVTIGAAAELITRPGELTTTYTMHAVNALLCAVAAVGTRRGRALPKVLFPLFIASVPITFILGFAAVDFGRAELNTWQPFGAFVPLMMLLTFAKSWKPAIVASAVLLATAAVTTGVIWQDPSSAAMAVPIGAALPAGLAACWFYFIRTVTTVIEHINAERRLAWTARVETATRSAADRARDRWRAAGLRESLDLLNNLADGTADPQDPVIQAAAVAEEAYLRQLCLLSPDVIQMGPWLGRALAEARKRSVRLTLRTGNVDLPDPESAALLGSFMLAAIAATPTGEDLTIGMFQIADHGQFTLVGRHPHTVDSSTNWTIPSAWEIDQYHRDDQDLIEISWRT